ncbi:MAG: hypothetical protein EP297_04420 [Gammaproteobacteria bacterium]|nr:MAG: hypothetical protein EP297_04420 [Gammaproteobacteria bacterium]
MVQRLPDQTRAFFLARGFDKESADILGKKGCVFQSIMKNTAEKSATSLIDIDLKLWRMSQPNSSTTGIRLSSDWLKLWQHRGLGKSSQIAFKWSFFPTVQHFQGGDYNWGMTSYGLPPGASFDLTVVWKENGQPHTEILPGIECAQDR